MTAWNETFVTIVLVGLRWMYKHFGIENLAKETVSALKFFQGLVTKRVLTIRINLDANLNSGS